jgi:DNA end-binding protein Ku
VVLTKDDFKAAALERDRRVSVTDFVPAEDIDDRYFDHPYYLLPDKGAEQAYAIFREALKQVGRVGIGKVILRDRQHLVAVESLDDHLMLTVVRFSDEIVDAPRMPEVDRVRVPPRELKLATGLIEALAAEWKPDQYTDDYQQNLQKIIKAKLKGKTIKLEDEGRPMSAEVVDLAERLRASLRIAGTSRPTRSRSTKKKKRAA